MKGSFPMYNLFPAVGPPPASIFSTFHYSNCTTSVSALVPPIRTFECATRLSASSHPYTLDLLRCRTRSHSKSFIPCTAYLWNSLPGACFPPSHNLDCFRRNINSYLQLPKLFFTSLAPQPELIQEMQ